jgi:hypothetical protein
MASHSADRAKEAFDFLKGELPHCEDMLRYLDEPGQVMPLRQSINQGDIDISVLTFKLGKANGSKSSSRKSDGQIYHTFNTDSFQDRVSEQSPSYRAERVQRKHLTKPAFQKLPQVN